jgi:muconate cycloisomerase
MPVKHSLAYRSQTENLVVKVSTDNGVSGYGEGIAREYVTGETVEGSLRFLRDYLLPRISAVKTSDPPELMQNLAGLVTPEKRAQAPAACCALELAILDAAGKSWGQSVAELFGGVRQPLVYSAVIPMLPRDDFEQFLYQVRDFEMGQVKLKVGSDNDLEALTLARQILGDEVDLRVDANGVWGAEEAESRIAAMMAFGISGVEQPVAKENFQGLARVAERVSVPIIADESLCTEQDAEQLASLGACQVFNLRLSKCGGMITTARIHQIARKKGIAAQLGCQVGETGILAAAGRQFAAIHKLLYLEGSYSDHLLEEDIVNEPVDFGPGGVAQHLDGPGLGVTVNEQALHRFVTMQKEILL